MRLWALLIVFALTPLCQAGNSYYRPSYSYSGGYSGSYSYYRPYSYSYYYSNPPSYGAPYYQSYSGPDYQYAPSSLYYPPQRQEVVQPTYPGGYTYYPEHQEEGTRYPAGFYKYVQGQGWLYVQRPGMAVQQFGRTVQSAPAAELLKGPKEVPELRGAPQRAMPGTEPSQEELQRLRLMLEMLDRVKKP